jgi:hypothetical protein
LCDNPRHALPGAILNTFAANDFLSRGTRKRIGRGTDGGVGSVINQADESTVNALWSLNRP